MSVQHPGRRRGTPSPSHNTSTGPMFFWGVPQSQIGVPQSWPEGTPGYQVRMGYPPQDRLCRRRNASYDFPQEDCLVDVNYEQDWEKYLSPKQNTCDYQKELWSGGALNSMLLTLHIIQRELFRQLFSKMEHRFSYHKAQFYVINGSNSWRILCQNMECGFIVYSNNKTSSWAHTTNIMVFWVLADNIYWAQDHMLKIWILLLFLHSVDSEKMYWLHKEWSQNSSCRKL